MAGTEIELDPVDFITIDTIGPKGKRIFYLQAGQGSQIVSLVIEKEQAWALGEAIRELIDELDKRDALSTEVNLDTLDMALREPIEPLFRVSQMGLGYDEERKMVILVAQELVTRAVDDDDLVGNLGADEDDDAIQPDVVKMACTREQMRALSDYAIVTVKSGRADPKQNGRIIYYWT